MFKFNFTNKTGEKISKNFFNKYVEKVFFVFKSDINKLLNGKNGHINLILIGDREIHKINKENRGIDAPTDVISFAFLDAKNFNIKNSDLIIGDIFISMETAKRQAKEHEHTVKNELAVLFVHGLLHLLGFDHKNDKQEKEMGKYMNNLLKHVVQVYYLPIVCIISLFL